MFYTKNNQMVFSETESELYATAISRPFEAKVSRAVGLLKMYEQKALRLSPEGYYLAFSGGKDSCVIMELAKMAGVKFSAHYNQTTIDPPELVSFIREKHPEVNFEWQNKSREGFFDMVRRWGLPTPMARWCCSIFKEGGGHGRVRIVGVRAEESARRKRLWKEVQTKMGEEFVAPIVYWTDEDVWRFIRERGIPYCSLYDEGWKRIGCIGCPMQSVSKLNKEFERWPKFELAYKNSAYKYFERREKRIAEGTYRGKVNKSKRFGTPEEYWIRWRNQMNRRTNTECVYGQMKEQIGG